MHDHEGQTQAATICSRGGGQFIWLNYFPPG